MMRFALSFAWLGIAAVTASGISCGGGGGTCSMVNACGGNIVGNWRVTSSCLKITGTLTDSECPTSTVNASLQVNGTASYMADLTYSMALVLSGTETIGFPVSCLTSTGVTVTCDQLNQVFAANPPDPSISSIHCSPADGGGCNCVTNVSAMTVDESGTYTTAAGILTTTQAGSAADPGGGYCVQGNRLDLTPPSSMSQAGVISSGDLTFTRQ